MRSGFCRPNIPENISDPSPGPCYGTTATTTAGRRLLSPHLYAALSGRRIACPNRRVRPEQSALYEAQKRQGLLTYGANAAQDHAQVSRTLLRSLRYLQRTYTGPLAGPKVY